MAYQTTAKPEEPWEPAIARRRDPVNGWVYFFLGEDTGRWKIGHGKDVERRLRACQVGCSEVLSVYAVIPAVDLAGLERALHKRFAAHRLHGEWFEAGPDIADFGDMYGYELNGTHRLWEEMYPDDWPTPRLPPAYRF